jgi:Chaperone of endosialidase
MNRGSTIVNNQASTKNENKTMTTLHLKKSICRSPFRLGFLLIALAWSALSPMARAVNPAPDGGYPNENTAEGDNALLNLTTGGGNTAIGFDALFSNTTGSSNTATGSDALQNNTVGYVNTAIGSNALVSNANGWGNTATGASALYGNTSGVDNTATGWTALGSNTIGSGNTANGVTALLSNTTGSDNTAFGVQALFSNKTGNSNTATGVNALFSNTIGNRNTATGFRALLANKTGEGNTATGINALSSNTAGDNTATGGSALFSNTTGNRNTADGFQALYNNSTGSYNIAVGRNAGVKLTTGNNNIDIGNPGVPAEAATIRIGTTGTQTATYIAGINGVTVANGVGVVVNSTGQLGTVTSSARFKEAIKPMDKASEAILALQPVTFRYKQELDPDKIPQFGLIAEEVEKVNSDLVVRDEDGKVNTVRYEAVNAMLLNEFLKEHRKVEDLQKQVAALTAGLQKVSAAVELNKPAPTQVADNR